jgi:hypothetical protein
MKRYSLKSGDVLEVNVPNRGYGYVRALGKDDFAVLFEIFDQLFPSPLQDNEFVNAGLKVRTVAYVNPPAAKASWPLRVRGFPGSNELPTTFSGAPKYGWTRVSSDGRREVIAGGASYEKLVVQGYVHRALWLPKDVEKYLETNEPLCWTQWPS